MGIGSSKSKKKQVIQTNDNLELNRQIEDLTRQLNESSHMIKLQTESIKIRDQDIRNVQEALKEREVKWALSLQTAQPWSQKPPIRSKHTKGSQQENKPGISGPSSDSDRSRLPFEDERIVPY